uniref:Uncharacterized protein n=1 Tax=Lygus hesperus TaxID=30085 RepID=A0A146M231_LYGHE
MGEQIRVWRHLPPPHYPVNFHTQYNNASVPASELLKQPYSKFLFPQKLSTEGWDISLWEPILHYRDIVLKSYSMYMSHLESSTVCCNLSVQDLGIDTVAFEHTRQSYVDRVRVLKDRGVGCVPSLPHGRPWVMQHTQRPIQQHEGSSTSPQKFTLTCVGENYENFLRF